MKKTIAILGLGMLLYVLFVSNENAEVRRKILVGSVKVSFANN